VLAYLSSGVETIYVPVVGKCPLRQVSFMPIAKFQLYRPCWKDRSCGGNPDITWAEKVGR